MKNTPSRFFSLVLLCLLIEPRVSSGQESQGDTSHISNHSSARKRFINRIELFGGPGLSFNYGNKFIENYSDEHVKNKRLVKTGYTVGVGIYHSVSDDISINARIVFEKKGSKSELNVPLQLDRLEITSEYTYTYQTIVIAPQMFIDKKKKVTLAIGGYYSIIKRVKGYESVYDNQDKTTSTGSFTGRSLRGLDNDGHVVSLTYIPGLQSFEKYDYGLFLGCGYLFKIKKDQAISVQLINNFGLQNINRIIDGNQPEKNNTLCLSIGYNLQRKNKHQE